MVSAHLSFVRIRISALAYTSCLSILTFAIVLFVLPTAGRQHIAALTVIAIASLVVGLAACSALVAPKTECCSRRPRHGIRRKMYVAIEALCSVASLPLLAAAIILETGLAPAHTTQTGPSRNPNGTSFDPHAGHTLSVLLLIFSCSILLVVVTYTGLITGLAIYTHKRTQRANIWFSDAASVTPAFIFPPALRFLQTEQDDSVSEADLERARRSHGVRIQHLDVTPTLHTFLRQIRSRERTRHTLAPDCTCGEKLQWGPTRSDEYRAVGKVYARIWKIIAEREAQERARTLGRGSGRQRSWTMPVPILRLPTERERRRSVFLVAFDATRLER